MLCRLSVSLSLERGPCWEPFACITRVQFEHVFMHMSEVLRVRDNQLLEVPMHTPSHTIHKSANPVLNVTHIHKVISSIMACVLPLCCPRPMHMLAFVALLHTGCAAKKVGSNQVIPRCIGSWTVCCAVRDWTDMADQDGCSPTGLRCMLALDTTHISSRGCPGWFTRAI